MPQEYVQSTDYLFEFDKVFNKYCLLVKSNESVDDVAKKEKEWLERTKVKVLLD